MSQPQAIPDDLIDFTDLPLERDNQRFLKELLRELSGVLEDSVGLDEAEGFISLVGGRIGLLMNTEYCQALGVNQLSTAQVAAVLVDLKQRIDGGFSIDRVEHDAIYLKNTRCPFGEYVEGRESLCMMTSNVFGRIAAENFGYARVNLVDTIARGQPQCKVVVHFEPGEDGREYFS